mmetsp:Transcript_20826/g.37962  ORF Transcript_20826/g.37962 Transcript_20826/m.37962 type:complete len:297 (-) Transcript_20826:94-984(-)
MGANQAAAAQPLNGGRLAVAQADDDRRRRLGQKSAQARAAAKKVKTDIKEAAQSVLHHDHADSKQTKPTETERGSISSNTTVSQTVMPPTSSPSKGGSAPPAEPEVKTMTSMSSMSSTFDVGHRLESLAKQTKVDKQPKQRVIPTTSYTLDTQQDAATEAQRKAVRFASTNSAYSAPANHGSYIQDFPQEEFELEEAHHEEKQAAAPGLPPALLDALPDDVAEAAQSMWFKAMAMVGYPAEEEEEDEEDEGVEAGHAAHQPTTASWSRSAGGWGMARCGVPTIRTESLEFQPGYAQ